MHLTDDELDVLIAGGDIPERHGHLAECAACAGAAESRALEEALSDPETWVTLDELATGRGSSPLQALQEQMRREDEDAERMLGRLAVSPYRFLWSILNVRKRRFRTGGVVRFLNRAAHDECERDPLHARNLADAAIAIAQSLPDDLYPASGVEHLRGIAWKEHANACRYLGAFDVALQSLDRAERAFRRLLVADLHLASVDLVRATVQSEMDRQEDAVRLAKKAAAEFARLGDTRRWAHAQLVLGNALFYSRAFEAARETFVSILAVTDRIDPAFKARVEFNVANCELELGRLDLAAMQYVALLPVYEELRLPTEVVRLHWNIGCLSLRAGNPAEAARRLRATREEALRLHMTDDAAKITLDLVAALLAVNQTKNIPSLLANAIRHFKEAGQSASVVAATAYLRQAAAASSLTPNVVQFVREFIARAERDPKLVFAPPA